MRYPFDQSERAEELFMNPDNNDGVHQSDAIHYSYFELRAMFVYFFENKIATFKDWLEHINFPDIEKYTLNDAGKNISCYTDDVKELAQRPTKKLYHYVKHNITRANMQKYLPKIERYFDDYFKRAFYLVDMDILSVSVTPLHSKSKYIYNYNDKHSFIDALVSYKNTLSSKPDFIEYNAIHYKSVDLLRSKGHIYANAYKNMDYGLTVWERELLFSNGFAQNISKDI